MNAIESKVQASFDAAQLTPMPWSSPPNASYGAHDHHAPKLLFCTQGLITFTLYQGGGRKEVTLKPGDRLDLPAHTQHSAVVGPDGVTCWEAFKED